MRTAFALSAAALAGSALAAPHHARHQHRDVHVVNVVETRVQTMYVTEETWAPQPTAAAKAPAEAMYQAGPVTTVVYEEAPGPAPTSETYQAAAPVKESPAPVKESPAPIKEAPAPVYEAPTSVSEAPAPPPTSEAPVPVSTPEAPAPKASAPASSDPSYMSVVNDWRAKIGMSSLEFDSMLASNTLKVITAWDGRAWDETSEDIHKLYPGTNAQVCGPAPQDDFEHCFVGGWLCEKPSLPGLDGICVTETKGYMLTSTGHADILTDDTYTKIGCGYYKEGWCCDLS